MVEDQLRMELLTVFTDIIDTVLFFRRQCLGRRNTVCFNIFFLVFFEAIGVTSVENIIVEKSKRKNEMK